MTALEVLTAPVVRKEPTVQYDEARRSHQRQSLLAHLANRHQDWEDEREAEAILRQYAETELHPSTSDPARRRTRPPHGDGL